MEKTVCFRDFEERDIDFIYKCKNDEKLNSMISGQWHPFTYEEAAKWVHGCMGEHETYKFWAIATNDEEKRIVGWCSLSDIDYSNKSVCYHGLVIADPCYNDGIAWIETNLFVFDYIFEILKLNRMYGTALLGHKTSNAAEFVFFQDREGIQREAIYKNGKYYDLVLSAMLRRDYLLHKDNGDYKITNLLKRIRTYKKQYNESIHFPWSK